MASYTITEEEYKKARFENPVKLYKKLIFWFVAFFILGASIWYEQYAFSIIWSIILIFIHLVTKVIPIQSESRLINNPFSVGPYEVEFECDCYFVQQGDSILKLAVNQLGSVHDIKELYRLDHKSHFSLVVPKRTLSEAELAIIIDYKRSYPGFPEKQESPNW